VVVVVVVRPGRPCATTRVTSPARSNAPAADAPPTKTEATRRL